MRILLVDDDAFIRIMFRKMFKGTEFILTEAQNGEEAMTALRNNEFDAVITDWMMPKMDGIELITNIRAKISDPPFILMVTAISTDDAMKLAMDAGADDFVTKPFFRDPLLTSLRNGIQRSRQGKGATRVISTRKELPKRSLIGIGIASSTGRASNAAEIIPGYPQNEQCGDLSCSARSGVDAQIIRAEIEGCDTDGGIRWRRRNAVLGRKYLSRAR
jgi:DNA-binding response OmpR family regulator